MKLITLFIGFLILFQHSIYAVDPANGKVESLTDKLKEIVKEGTTTQEETLTSINKPKSFFSTITQINDQQITTNFQDSDLILQVNDKTAYVDLKQQKSKLTNFKVGQTILSMGYFNQDGTLDCRRIVATENKTVQNNNQIITGKIVDVSQSQSSPIFVLIPFQNKNEQYQIKIDTKTTISDTNQKKIASSDIIITGKEIIAIIRPETESGQTFYASRIINLEAIQSPTPTIKP